MQAQRFIIRTTLLIIVGGTLLLMLPWAHTAGAANSPLTALFMSTSAVCVTGHTLVDISRHYTILGKLILLLLIQLGGLGFMLMGIFFLALTGRRLSLQNEMALLDVLKIEEAKYLKLLLRQSVFFSLLLEALGAFLLAWRWHAAYHQPLPTALLNGVFHAVSAYCNAGFSLFPGNLADFRSDPVIIGIIAVLIVIGGLGFAVIYDLSDYRFWRRNRLQRGQLSLHTKIVLSASLGLLVLGAAGMAVLEWSNTLANFSWPQRIFTAVFHSITARTAGFNLISMAETTPAARFLNLVLMLIGGSPGSTAGGLKTTTFIVLLAATFTMIRRKHEVVAFQRTITTRNTEMALAIFMLSAACLAILYGLLLAAERANLQNGVFSTDFLLFDTVSAFGTVGLSAGAVPLLSPIGKILMVAAMFIGRVGPLTIALLVGLKGARQLVRAPEEHVMVG